MTVPRIILTSGEPAGIGPDLCISIASRPWPCEVIVAADEDVLTQRARQLQASVRISRYDRSSSGAGAHQPGDLRVLHVPTAAPVQPGVLDPANARYVLRMLDVATEGCLSGEFHAMVTAPVQKSVINEAGVRFFGHTEYLAEHSGGARPVMMLAAGKLRVALVTTHLPLSEVSRAITSELLEEVLRVVDRDLRGRFAIATPRLLVCGLNPHAGESGHLGREEIDVIAPTLRRLGASGLHVIGPAPADTAFTPHMLAQADVVVAMFHDQGLPVIKYSGFGDAVNVTLGLPIIRTSVDHGTALSLAGSGKADAGSLVTATDLAIELARRSAAAD